MKTLRHLLLAAGAVALIASMAVATPKWFKLFDDTYKPKPDTQLAKAKCALCHEKPNGTGGWNAYGKLLKGKKMEAASLKAIENIDIFKNGYTNIEKIKAGMLPSDPNAHPKK